MGQRSSWRCIALAAVLLACHRDPPAVRAVKSTVTRYNERLVEAYLEGNPMPLAGIAEVPEMQRVDRIVSALSARGQFMKARQNAMKFQRVTVQAESAEAETEESWSYEHRPLAQRDRATQVKFLKYRMVYRLKRVPGGWRITNVEEQPEGAPPPHAAR